MAVTLSEQEKQALGEIFISFNQKKSFLDKIVYPVKTLSTYIFQPKRKHKREKKQH